MSLPEANELQRVLLADVVPKALDGRLTFSGSHLRLVLARAEVSEEQRQPVVDSCVAGLFLSPSGDDSYMPTIFAILPTIEGSVASATITTVLAFLRKKALFEPEFEQFTLREIRESSTSSPGMAYTRLHALISIAHLHGGDRSGAINDGSFAFSRPAHIEKIVSWNGQIGPFIDHERRTLESTTSSRTVDLAPRPPASQSRFPGWSVIEPLGEGGQGTTFTVRRDDGSDRVFVLKTPKERPRGLNRFRREPDRLATLDHPRILKLIDPRPDHDPPFFVTEWCADGELDRERLAGLALPKRLAIFHGICEGVSAAHAVGIVHRDIKPQNILFRSFPDDVVVADFGISFARDAEGRLTETNEHAGARNYTTPEFEAGRANDEDVTPAGDVFSLGKLLYFILTGRMFHWASFSKPARELVADNPGVAVYRFAHDLLGKTVIEDRKARLQDAAALVVEAKRLMEIMESDAPYIARDYRPRCAFCKVGTYGVELVPPDQARQVNESYRRVLNTSGGFVIMTCGHCGHRQEFAPTTSQWEALWNRTAT